MSNDKGEKKRRERTGPGEGGEAKEEGGSVVGDAGEQTSAGCPLCASRPGLIDDVFEAIQDGVSVLDRDLRIIRVNRWMEKMYAHHAPLEGKLCHEVYQGRGSVCPFCPCTRAMETGETHTSVVPYPSEDDPSGWIELSAFPLKTQSGAVEGVIEYVKDITQRVQAKHEVEHVNEELERVNESLEERVRERTARFEALNRELNAFAYAVSHDLRAPLRAVEGFSSAMLEDYGDTLDEAASHYLDRILEGTRNMARLIEGLLALSRLTRSSLEREEVDLTQMAHSVCESICDSGRADHLDCRIAEGLRAHCDRRLLRVLLENLLGNAFKFSAGQDPAVVEMGVLSGEELEAKAERGMAKERKAEEVPRDEGPVFYAKDNGVGFDMRHAEKLFTAFGRLHKATEFPGDGIGLATVQRIAHRHGGRVWAQGEVGHGATFYFTLGSARPMGGPESRPREDKTLEETPSGGDDDQ